MVVCIELIHYMGTEIHIHIGYGNIEVKRGNSEEMDIIAKGGEIERICFFCLCDNSFFSGLSSLL